MPGKSEDLRSNMRRGRSRSPSKFIKSSKKSIRGFLTGTSKKKAKSEKKLAESAKAPIPSSNGIAKFLTDINDEESTVVVNVEIDAGSTQTTLPTTPAQTPDKMPPQDVPAETPEPTKSEPVPNVEPTVKPEETSQPKILPSDIPLHVVVLLMDAKSRRFELIQLAFDADSAYVQDVLKQAALSATEEALRSQTYLNVCLPDGSVMENNSMLKHYCKKITKQHHILLALPKGMTSSECIKLSQPILNDPKVKTMLKGIDSAAGAINKESKSGTSSPSSEPITGEPPEEMAKESKPPASSTSTRSTPEIPSTLDDSSSANPSLKLSLILMVILAPILAFVQARITSSLSPGDVLLPGHWRSKCGFLSLVSECQDSVLELTTDGLLTLTENGDVIWKMTGTCDADEECSATINEDGHILIGSSAPFLEVGELENVTPWPFTPKPSVKSKKRRV